MACARLGVLAALLGNVPAVAATAPDPRRFDLDIESSTLVEALRELSGRTGLQIVRFNDPHGVEPRSLPVTGTFSVDEARRRAGRHWARPGM